MLRHACGFALADQGADTQLIQDFLGHRNIQHTVMYTATNPARFEPRQGQANFDNEDKSRWLSWRGKNQ